MRSVQEAAGRVRMYLQAVAAVEAPQTAETHAGMLRKLGLRDIQFQSAGLRSGGKFALDIRGSLKCWMNIHVIAFMLIFDYKSNFLQDNHQYFIYKFNTSKQDQNPSVIEIAAPKMLAPVFEGEPVNEKRAYDFTRRDG